MIEAIVTCVDYADYLAETLPLLVRIVDSVLVVSSPNDLETKRITKANGVDLLATEVFYRDGATFNKGAAIQEGLKTLNQTDWVLHIDADIGLLDPLKTNELEPECFHWVAKKNIVGRVEWEGVLRGNPPKRRSMKRRPVGYFQLWNANAIKLAYPDDVPHAGKSDKDFIDSNWSREQCRRIPSYVAYHLQMPGDVNKQNWQGRTSEPFA